MGLYGVSPDFIQLQYDWNSMHINVYELDDEMLVSKKMIIFFLVFITILGKMTWDSSVLIISDSICKCLQDMRNTGVQAFRGLSSDRFLWEAEEYDLFI